MVNFISGSDDFNGDGQSFPAGIFFGIDIDFLYVAMQGHLLQLLNRLLKDRTVRVFEDKLDYTLRHIPFLTGTYNGKSCIPGKSKLAVILKAYL